MIELQIQEDKNKYMFATLPYFYATHMWHKKYPDGNP